MFSNLQRYRSKGAFTLLEIIFALMIFTIMILLFAAIIPIATRSTKYGNTYAVASSMALHKINQLESLGYTQMDGAVLETKQVVDSGWSGASPNPNGMETVSGEFTEVDKLWKFFPGGETSSGTRNTGAEAPKGILTLEPWTASVQTIGGIKIASLIRATVTLEWQVGKNPRSKFTVTRLIPKAKIL